MDDDLFIKQKSQRIDHIHIITPNYPLKRFPERGVFVESLVREWQASGVKCSITAPTSLSVLARSSKFPKKKTVFAGDHIKRPVYLSFSDRNIFGLESQELNLVMFYRTVMRTISRQTLPDVYYGKFYSGAIAAFKAKEKFAIPAFADFGQSRFYWNRNQKAFAYAKEIISKLDGAVCVSEDLVVEMKLLGLPEERILLAPNEVNIDHFRPLDRDACRKKLSLPTDHFIVVFVGHFLEAKGPLRVLAAIERLGHNNISAVFLGRGKQKPESKQTLHIGSVPRDELPVWLNAADVFMLPTETEGSCNAINEALSCGLPVISSDISNVSKQVPPSSSILVNPHDITELSRALFMVYESEDVRSTMSKAALTIRQKQSATNRANRILEWMSSIL